MNSWIHAHCNAFEFFGGVLELLIPDNLMDNLLFPIGDIYLLCSFTKGALYMSPPVPMIPCKYRRWQGLATL